MKRIASLICQFLFAVIIALVYSGCASSLQGPAFTPINEIPEGKSLIYLYRPDDKKRTEFEIKCNENQICIMENKGYYPFFIGEGKVEITSTVKFKMFATGLLDAGLYGSTDFVFKAEPGKIYYLECEADGGSGGQKLNIKIVPENFGSIRIKDCILLPSVTQQ